LTLSVAALAGPSRYSITVGADALSKFEEVIAKPLASPLGAFALAAP